MLLVLEVRRRLLMLLLLCRVVQIRYRCWCSRKMPFRSAWHVKGSSAVRTVVTLHWRVMLEVLLLLVLTVVIRQQCRRLSERDVRRWYSSVVLVMCVRVEVLGVRKVYKRLLLLLLLLLLVVMHGQQQVCTVMKVVRVLVGGVCAWAVWL